MLIHVSRGGEQFGPYTLEDANAYLAQGSLLPTDEGWYEGAPGWMPITEVPGIQWGTAPASAAAVGKTQTHSKMLLCAGIAAGVLTVLGVVGWGYPGVFKKENASGPVDQTGSADSPESPKQKAASKASSSATGTLSFANTAEPIFRKHSCFDCHSSKESNKVEADFDLSDRSTWRAFLAPNQQGNPTTTPLMLALTATDANGKPMPPRGPRVSDADVETIKKWIVAEWKK